MPLISPKNAIQQFLFDNIVKQLAHLAHNLQIKTIAKRIRIGTSCMD